MNWRELRESGEWGNMGAITSDMVLEKAQAIAAGLQYKDVWAVTYQPQNASRYDLWFVPIHGRPEPWMLAALENYQSCYRFNLATWLNPTYVTEKLGPNLGIADGACIAELLMALGEVIGAHAEPV
jgi:hypothetical protein